MQQIAIQDANILIDLLKTGLFAHCLALDYQFVTTDLVFNELYDSQQAEIQPHIDSGKFVIITIADIELIEIQLISLQDKKLSEQDWSCFYYAEKKAAILLSGDNRLKTMAESKGVEAHGIIWLIDKIRDCRILADSHCCEALRELIRINKRLPIIECEERIKNWSGEKNIAG